MPRCRERLNAYFDIVCKYLFYLNSELNMFHVQIQIVNYFYFEYQSVKPFVGMEWKM